MRTLYITLWLILLIILYLVIWRKFKLGKYGLIGLFLVAVLLWLGGSSVISLNTISPEVKEKLDQVTSLYGDTFIKTDGGKIYININEEWLDLANVKVVGGFLTDDIYIEYEGREIYLGHSGVVNVIKTLESLDLIE